MTVVRRWSLGLRGWVVLLGTALIWAAPAQALLPSGQYGPQLRLALDRDEDGPLLTGLYERSEDGSHCRFALYGRPLTDGQWKLLLAAGDDRVLGRAQADQARWQMQLARAPRGCEAFHESLTAAPSFELTQSQDWRQIRLIDSPRAHFHERPTAQAQRRAYLVRGDAIAISDDQDAFVLALYLTAGRSTDGWLARDALQPLTFDALGEKRWRRPLPGLSAPATVQQRLAWRDWLDWSDDCEARFQAQHAGDQSGGLNLLSFGATANLLRISCGSLAYQESFIYAWLPPGRLERSQLLTLPGYPPDLGEERLSSAHSTLYGLDEVDRQRGEITILTRYRGAGDCGQWQRYDIAADGPVLREWRERACDAPLLDDENLPLPQEWPLHTTDTDPS